MAHFHLEKHKSYWEKMIDLKPITIRKQKIRTWNAFKGILGVSLCPNLVPRNITGKPKRNNINKS